MNLSLLRSLESNKFTKVPITTSPNAHATVRDASGHWVRSYRNLGWVIAHIGRQGFVDLHWEVSVGLTQTKSYGLLSGPGDHLIDELSSNPYVLWIMDWDTRSPMWLEPTMGRAVSAEHSRGLVLDFGEPVWAGSDHTYLDIEAGRQN